MKLLGRVHAWQKDRDRFTAAVHGRELMDDTPAAAAAVPLVGGGGLRSFHERMKKRLRIP